MYAAVKRVLREQEKQQRLELERERKRLERLLQIQLQSSTLLGRRHSSGDLSDGDSVPIIIPFRRERLAQLQKSLSSGQSFSSSDLRLLASLGPALFRVATAEQDESCGDEVQRSLTSNIEEPRDSVSIPPVVEEVEVEVERGGVAKNSQNESRCIFCGRRWSQRALVASGGVALLVGIIILSMSGLAYADCRLTPFILTVILGLLILIFGIALLLLGINVSIPHPCLGAGSCCGRNSSNAVNIDASEISVTSRTSANSPVVPVQQAERVGENSKSIGIYIKK